MQDFVHQPNGLDWSLIFGCGHGIILAIIQAASFYIRDPANQQGYSPRAPFDRSRYSFVNIRDISCSIFSLFRTSFPYGSRALTA